MIIIRIETIQQSRHHVDVSTCHSVTVSKFASRAGHGVTDGQTEGLDRDFANQCYKLNNVIKCIHNAMVYQSSRYRSLFYDQQSLLGPQGNDRFHTLSQNCSSKRKTAPDSSLWYFQTLAMTVHAP